MVSMMVYDTIKTEYDVLNKIIYRVAALLTEEKWQVDYASCRAELETFFGDEPLLDLLCYDVTGAGSIDYLEQIRKNYQEAGLMLIADVSLSPMDYIRPSILASSLVLRPFSSEQMQASLTELTENLLQKSQQESQEETFVVETQEGKTYVPLNQIYYFEAREKKIYLRLKKQELTFYETIEHLSNRLPEMFLRCHRSFIVNRKKIQKVMLSKNLILLDRSMELPLSRSYKAVFKEMK
ncbi:MAG: LytR/AlgR family response regulator transcription factor [Lachnospiraceae bacterium]